MRAILAHSPKQIRQIARSIAAFGFNVSMLIDAEGQVIASHGHVLACHQQRKDAARPGSLEVGFAVGTGCAAGGLGICKARRCWILSSTNSVLV